ncbi:MAG TPA: N-acetylmuramoyl-L-alanine amidase, partial [Candidatus Xenobia bacterium]
GSIVVRANGPLQGTFQGTSLRFDHVAWGLSSDDLTVGSVQIHVEQHGDGGAPTVLQVALAPHSRAVLAAVADPDECRLDVVEGSSVTAAVTPTPEVATPYTNVTPGGRLIVLDPGHGGSDPGCHCPWTGLEEKEVTLDMCLQLKSALEARGVKVMLTRNDDRDVTYPHSPDTEELGARAAVANRHHATLFVSLHCNASVSHALRGTSIHWYKHKDLRLATLLEVGLKSAALAPVHSLIHSNFYVLRHTWGPSVLVETAYLTNKADETLLGSEGFRKQMVDVLADTLAQYVGALSNSLGRAGRHSTGYNRK